MPLETAMLQIKKQMNRTILLDDKNLQFNLKTYRAHKDQAPLTELIVFQIASSLKAKLTDLAQHHKVKLYNNRVRLNQTHRGY